MTSVNTKDEGEENAEVDIAAAMEQIKANPFKAEGYERQVPLAESDGSITVVSNGGEETEPETKEE